MCSLAQKIKAEDMPPLVLKRIIVMTSSTYIIHVSDRALTGGFKMRGDILPG